LIVALAGSRQWLSALQMTTMIQQWLLHKGQGSRGKACSTWYRCDCCISDDNNNNNGMTTIWLLHQWLVSSGLVLCKWQWWRWWRQCNCCISSGLGWYCNDWLLHQWQVGSGLACSTSWQWWWQCDVIS
jgi:hypothetical protein